MMAVDNPGDLSENGSVAKNMLQENADGHEDNAEEDHKGSDDEDDDEGTQSCWRVKKKPKEGHNLVLLLVSSC
jgi:hypothetical protein